MTNPDQLASEFRSLAEEIARRAGLGMTTDCERLLRYFISEGVTRLRCERLLDDAPKVAEARQNLTTFVERMVLVASEQHLRELHENVFRLIKRSLCPLFPFCQPEDQDGQ